MIALKSAGLERRAQRSRCDGARRSTSRAHGCGGCPAKKRKASAFSKSSNGRWISERPSPKSARSANRFRVPAAIVARPGGAAQVVAPIDGRLIQVAPLGPGSTVTQGQELARLLPPPSMPGELPQLEQARAEAAVEAELAIRDRERAERLVSAGAAPQKRLDEARAVEAQASCAAACGQKRRLRSTNAARTGTGGGNASGLFILAIADNRSHLARVRRRRART